MIQLLGWCSCFVVISIYKPQGTFDNLFYSPISIEEVAEGLVTVADGLVTVAEGLVTVTEGLLLTVAVG